MFISIFMEIKYLIDEILSRTGYTSDNYRKEDADEANRKDVYDMNVNTFTSYLIKRTVCRSLKACNLKKIG